MDIQPTQDTHRTQRRRPTIAKEWQLAVLKRLQSESSSPTEEQRSVAAAETGLGEKWVKHWFIRQRSKNAARNRKGQLATTKPHESRPHSVTVPTFKLQRCHPGAPSSRPVSTPVDAMPHLSSPASLEPPSPRPSSSATNSQAMPRSSPTVSAPMSLNNPLLILHTARTPMYSRDPLCNRYPDFSQFFRPQAHERVHTFELSIPISNHNHLSRLSVTPDVVSHTPVHSQGLPNMLNPLHLGSFPIDQNSSTNLQPCPVAFSMRLVDILSHSLVWHPVFLPV